MRYLNIGALLLNSASCTRVPSPKTLAGEWRQDSEYLQSKSLINRLSEIEEHESYEIFLAENWVAATRLVKKDSDGVAADTSSTDDEDDENEKRVYWTSYLSFSTDSEGNQFLTFNSHEGKTITAAVRFEGKRLILELVPHFD
jgi:hypothetical protein